MPSGIRWAREGCERRRRGQGPVPPFIAGRQTRTFVRTWRCDAGMGRLAHSELSDAIHVDHRSRRIKVQRVNSSTGQLTDLYTFSDTCQTEGSGKFAAIPGRLVHGERSVATRDHGRARGRFRCARRRTSLRVLAALIIFRNPGLRSPAGLTGFGVPRG